MKLFLDSAHVSEIEYALEMWRIDGVTTNPKHIQATGKPFKKVILEIAKLFQGSGKTVSVEVDPFLTDHDEMVKQAAALAALSPNFVIKLPATEAGFKALSLLNEKQIRVNLTLVFSTTQALQAMRMGAYFVSPFIGWKEANAEEARSLIEEIVTVRDNYEFATEVLVAAVRDGRQVADAALAGADIVTAGLEVYRNAFHHPYTDFGLGKFQEFWSKTAVE